MTTLRKGDMMSGGGPSRSPRPVGGGGSTLDCGSIRFETNLASPQAGVVATLTIGDELEVRLDTSGPRAIVVAVNVGGEVAGSIATRAGQLVRCIREGFEYGARILNISGGDV